MESIKSGEMVDSAGFEKVRPVFATSTVHPDDEVNRISTNTARIAELISEGRRALGGWHLTPLNERCRLMRLICRSLLDEATTIADTLSDEEGKVWEEGFLAEVVGVRDLFSYWNKSIGRMLAADRLFFNPILYPKKGATISREPIGLIALITPWNYPLMLALRNVVPAILSGNVVIHKPSEYSPRIAEILMRVMTKHLPGGVFQTVYGGPETGAALLDGEIDACSFIGSKSVGQKISLKLGGRMLPVALELGGKDAALILEDAPMERTVAGILWGAFHNAGQDCSSIERVFVPISRKEEFLAQVDEQIKQIDDGQIGRLINQQGFAKAKRHIEDTIKRGGKVIHGNRLDETGYRVAPTVLIDVQSDWPVMQEESFAPLLPVCWYLNVDEAITSINASEYGLSTSIWCGDSERAISLTDRIETGMICINNHSFHGAVPSCPWVGRKGSGSGVTNSKYALEFFTRPKLLVVDRSRKKELWWYPYNGVFKKMVRGMADTLSSSPLRVIWGYLTMLRCIPKRFK